MRLLSDADVVAALPPLAEVVDLVEDALVALAEGRADVPPKSGVSSAPGLFADAMPAAFPERNLLGCKWISVAPDNPVRGLPTASGLMILNDGRTGAPRALLAAAELTAVRTAAVSAACVRALAPEGVVSFLGAGVQARSHARVLHALGHDQLRVWARRSSALSALVAWGKDAAPGLRIVPVSSREAAVRDAAVVITALSIGLTDMAIPAVWPRQDALLLPLDYASSVGPDLAQACVLASDDVRQFVALRERKAALRGYPTPTAWTGHLLRGRPLEERLLCQNLGSALTDLVIAAAVVERAEASGAGQLLDS